MKKLCMAVLLYVPVILPSSNSASCEFPEEIIIHPSFYQNIEHINQKNLDNEDKLVLSYRHEEKNNNDTSVQIHISVNKETKLIEPQVSMPYKSDNPVQIIRWQQQAIAILVKSLIPTMKERAKVSLSELRKELVDSGCVSKCEEQVRRCAAKSSEVAKIEREISAFIKRNSNDSVHSQNDDA